MSAQTVEFRPVRQDDVAWLGTGPIPAKAYYDAGNFELECEAVFLRSWFQIGHVCGLSGQDSFIRREVEIANASEPWFGLWSTTQSCGAARNSRGSRRVARHPGDRMR